MAVIVTGNQTSTRSPAANFDTVITKTGEVVGTQNGMAYSTSNYSNTTYQIDGYLISSTNEAMRIEGGSQNTKIFVGTGGIVQGKNGSTNTGMNTLISNDGHIRSTDTASAINSYASGFRLENRGTITGGNNGIFVTEQARIFNDGTIVGTFNNALDISADATFVVNTGRLSGKNVGIDATYTVGAGVNAVGFVLNNTGMIQGGTTAIVTSDYGDRIANGGTIVGDVQLGLGDDVYTALHAGVVAGIVSGGDGADTLRGGEAGNELWGDAGADVLIGRGGQDVLLGGAGGDRLLGGSGVDTLDGGADDDTLSGGSDDDDLSGDDGADLLFGGNGEDVLSGGNGSDTLHGHSGDDTLAGGADDDRMLGGSNDDVLNGDAGADHLFGGPGADELSGGTGDDTLVGGRGGDALSGGDGTNLLYGQHGDDTLNAGDAGDQLFGGFNDDLLNGGAGADLMRGGRGGDALIGADGNDSLYGETGDDGLEGGAGDDLIYGGYHADTLRGGTGADVLDGGTQDDFLFGDAGADTLHGGKGEDTLSGGADADVFIYRQRGGFDLITDFDAADTLDLTAYGFDDAAEALDHAVDTAAGVRLTLDLYGREGLLLEGVTQADLADQILV